jgi:predicted dehydrogenase
LTVRPAKAGPRLVATDPFAGAAGRLRIGLLGCGDIATENAAGIQLAPNAELVAVYDPVSALADDVAKRYGGEASQSVAELLERRDLDAVFLCVPHHLHAPLALQAIDAGKHVIVEKPLSNDLSSAARIVAAAEEAGVTLSVCFPHRYGPNVMAAKRLIDAGAVGEIAGVLISAFSDKPPSYWHGGYTGRSTSDWRTSRSKAGGGFLIMNLSHLIDLVVHLTGLTAATCSAFTTTVDGPSEVEDTITLSIRYDNGAVGSVFGCSALRGNRSGKTELHLWGRDGHVTVEPDPKVYTVRALDSVVPARWVSLRDLTQHPIRAAFVSRFATAVATGKEPDIRPLEALQGQAVMEAAYRSAETGAMVEPAELLAAAVST